MSSMQGAGGAKEGGRPCRYYWSAEYDTKPATYLLLITIKQLD